MAPSVTNTADPLKNPYHGVFNYSKITGSFCGFGCILQQTGTYNGKINLTPWASASGTGNGGTVPPLVPSNCTADITAELAAGTGGHWSGTTWDGGNGCYQIPYGVTISTSGVTIQNATVYDSQVQNATTTAGTVGGFIPTFKIEGGGTGGKNGGWTPGGSNPAWTYIGANNVTMKNITVIGANQTGGYTPANVSAHAFAAQSSSGDNFDNIFTENTWGDSLYTFYGGSGNPSPPTTNLNVCNDGTPNCTYKVYNSGRDPITLNDMQGSGKSSWEHGTVNGVDTKFGPSTINNASLLGASGQGNAFAFESDLTGVGLAYPTLIYINNSNWQGLIRFTTYNQGTTIFNNDTSISGIQVLGGNSVTNGGGGPGATVIFNGGSYAYPNSPGILVRDEATTVFNQTLFPVAAGANTAWSVLNSSSLTFHTGNGKYFPPPPAGKNDSTSTVSVLPN